MSFIRELFRSAYGDWRLRMQGNPLVWRPKPGIRRTYELPGDWCFSGTDEGVWRWEQWEAAGDMVRVVAVGLGLDKADLGVYVLEVTLGRTNHVCWGQDRSGRV